MMENRIVGIIQARCSSSRLDNKIFADINGKPMIERIVDRVVKSKLIEELVVATSTTDTDTNLVNWCNDKGVYVYRGSELNV